MEGVRVWMGEWLALKWTMDPPNTMPCQSEVHPELEEWRWAGQSAIIDFLLVLLNKIQLYAMKLSSLEISMSANICHLRKYQI